MTRIVILANHLHAALAAAFRALLPAASIESFDLAGLAREGPARQAALHAAHASDHIVAQDANAAFGLLSTAALRAAGRKLHLLPPFRFAGFHPDSVTIPLDGADISGPTGTLHSRIAIAAYLAGLPAPDAAALFNSLVFARLGYYAAFGTERPRLIQSFAVYGFDIAGFFDAWMQPGCFMLSAANPRMRVLLDIAAMLCARMGETDIVSVTEAGVIHPLASAPTHPLFPDIAARLGVGPEGVFRGPAPASASGGAPRPTLYNLEDFLAASFTAFRRVPLSALRAVDGIPAAMQALYLREADFGRAPPRATADNPEDTVFLTWHGKLVSVEAATAMLIQTPVWPLDPDSEAANAGIVELPITAPTDIALAGGTVASPASRPGCVTLTHQGRSLTAGQHSLALRFAAEAAPNEDLFLPLRRAELAKLAALLGGGWTLEGETGPAGIRLRAGFVLAVGPHRIELAGARLTGGEDGAIGLETPDGSLRLRRDPASLTLAAPQADIDLLPAAATLEQFRAGPGFRLELHGASETIHLPLAPDLPARTWMLEKFHGGAPRLGRVAPRATALRAADKFVRLDRGAEGVIFDTQATWTRLAGRVLPALPDTDAAVRIEGPLCVFYDSGLRDPYSFLAEAALPLHILQAALPPGTRLLLPASLTELRDTGGFDPLAALTALGLGGLPLALANAKLVRAADVVWLDRDPIAALPAALVQSFRARVHALHPPAATGRRIFLRPAGGGGIANPAPIENFIKSRDFETVSLRDATAPEAIAMFAAAEFVIAPRCAALAGLLFCQPGTRVLELAPDDAFRPDFWHISEKLGLYHAVLPCQKSHLSETDLVVDAERFRNLFRMLRLMVA